jgi:hypothetical protein
MQPASWRPKALYSKYEIELLSRLPSRLYSLAWVDREGAAVLEVLKNVMDPKAEETPLSAYPDIVIFGHTGRKGPKNQPTTLGSTTDQALRQLSYPCLVIKELLPAGAKTYMMAVDWTSCSKRGLDILLTLVNSKVYKYKKPSFSIFYAICYKYVLNPLF